MLHKMLEISSLPKEIKRVVFKIFKKQKGGLQDLDYTILGRYLNNIYDQEYVRKTIEGLRTSQGDLDFEKGCSLLQVFVVSETEREYIAKVRKKVLENEELSRQLKQAQKDLEGGLTKKGRLGQQQGEVERKMEFEVRNHENKLEKANQRLNLSITKNKGLRTKIDLMRKEKNIIQKIFQ